jgi:hypothetical protein
MVVSIVKGPLGFGFSLGEPLSPLSSLSFKPAHSYVTAFIFLCVSKLACLFPLLPPLVSHLSKTTAFLSVFSEQQQLDLWEVFL